MHRDKCKTKTKIKEEKDMKNYKTIKGAKPYFLYLAKRFGMSFEAKKKLLACRTVPEIELAWTYLLVKQHFQGAA